MGVEKPDLLARPKAAEPSLAHKAMYMFMGGYGPTSSLAYLCAHGYALRLPFNLCSLRPDSHPFFNSEPDVSFQLGVEVGCDQVCSCGVCT